MRIEGFLSKVQEIARNARNEKELQRHFLNELEGFLRKSGQKDFELREDERAIRGRADARIGTLVFEFEAPGSLGQSTRQAEAVRQLLQYLEEYQSQGYEREKLAGLATDGTHIAAVLYDAEEDRFRTFDQYGNRVDLGQAFKPIEECGVLVRKLVLAPSRRMLSPDNLLESFGPGSSLCKQAVATLWSALENGLSLPRISALYNQWKELFALSTRRVVQSNELAQTLGSYGLGPYALETEEHVRRFLFVVHTYYSLLLKILGVAVADEMELGAGSLLKSIETDPLAGLDAAESVFPKLMVNVIERDVFSWFYDVWNNELSGTIRQLAQTVSVYDVEAIPADVLKRVYQYLIPPLLRKSLGEFYTKDWVADLVLDAIGYHGEGRILDPACGSGTFLVLAIKRVKRANGKLPSHKILEKITNSIVGFDVNPIAVMTARLNYLLAISDLLGARTTGIRIPVFLCDSVTVPKEAYDVSLGLKVFEVDTPVGSFRLPGTGDVIHLLRILENNVNKPSSVFLNAVQSKFRTQYVKANMGILKELHAKLQQLDKEGMNGLWCGLIRNFFAPLLTESFDFVVGNPPWVAPERVPKEYRDSIRHLMSASGFISSYEPNFQLARASFPGAEEQFVSCLPFLDRALKNYLKPHGKVAFLLTSSLLKSLNAAGFRRRAVELRTPKILDLTLYTNVHEGALCWSFVPVIENTPGDLDQEIDYTFFGVIAEGGAPEEKPKLKSFSWQTSGRQLPFSERDTGSPWLTAPPSVVRIYRRMQQSARIGDQYRLNRGIMTSLNMPYFATTASRGSSGFLTLQNSSKSEVIVEEGIVYPLIRGTDVDAWTFSHSYLILPHSPPDFRPIPESIMQQKYSEAYRHLLRYKKELEKRSDYSPDKGPFYMIFRLSRDKVKSWKVAYRLIATQLETCVIPPSIDDEILGERTAIIDHSVYFVNTRSRDEALYVCAMLNSTPLRTFAYDIAFPKGGIPYKQFYMWTIGVLPLPLFRPDVSACKSLVSLAESILRAKAGNVPDEGHQIELDRLSCELFGLEKTELDTLTEHYRMLSNAITDSQTPSSKSST